MSSVEEKIVCGGKMGSHDVSGVAPGGLSHLQKSAAQNYQSLVLVKD